MSGTISNAHAENRMNYTGDAPQRHHGPVPPATRYETDLSSVLAFAPRNTPLEILQIADERARLYCERVGLEPGDQITRHDGLKDEVLLPSTSAWHCRLPC